ncbi:MAG: hypothetical protein R6U68_06220, partial [Desulfobacteraceae bacterium]
MKKLFETTTIRNLELKNRFVRSATWLGMADKQGKATPRLIKTMTFPFARSVMVLISLGVAFPCLSAIPSQVADLTNLF